MMNEKQIYRRMNKCYQSEFGNYDFEAEWYGTDDPKEWLFSIPSLDENVRLTLDESNKRIIIEIQKMKGHTGTTKDLGNEWKLRGIYSW